MTPSGETVGRTASLSTPARSRGLLELLFPPIFAFAYAFYLAALPIDAFLDRENYVAYTVTSDIILLFNQMEGWLTVLTNEPLWLLINIALSSVLDPDETLRVIIFVPAFVTALLVLRQSNKNAIWLILFLFFPLVIKNYIIHLRQGVAIAVFLTGFFSKRKDIGLALIFASPFIHSSFFFVIMIMGMVFAAKNLTMSGRMKIALFMAMFLIVSVMLGYISAGLGARQWSEYRDIEIDVSGLAFVFWSLILAIFLSADKKFVNENIFPIALLSFYVATYFLIIVSGRIFESSTLLVLLAGLSLPGLKKNVFQALILLFAISNYAFRIDQPWLGWGVF